MNILEDARYNVAAGLAWFSFISYKSPSHVVYKIPYRRARAWPECMEAHMCQKVVTHMR